MPDIRLILHRQESYALLVATEMVRQMFGEEDGGIPLISQVRPIADNRDYTQMDFVFEAAESDWVAKVRVNAGDIWPKEGTVLLIRVDIGAGGSEYAFRLEGEPDCPIVRFSKLKVGG
ncbi:MAG: hypothetical protein WD159_01905 [Patescibacteria group bacterium]